ncbi:hypothetical protein BHE74_00052619 [Ensete ventricosum]|nr:hypothetical protein BHE74_00052619 [Ensete ventricosum]
MGGVGGGRLFLCVPLGTGVPYHTELSSVCWYGLGYVDREDVLIESLTVREMLYYSALLQLPGFFFQKKSFVEDAISAMSLGDFADSLIGGHCYTKSLPSGERRRVSIARELVMRPHVLFIDEPLYHLDRFCTVLSKDLQYHLVAAVFGAVVVVFAASLLLSSLLSLGLASRRCLRRLAAAVFAVVAVAWITSSTPGFLFVVVRCTSPPSLLPLAVVAVVATPLAVRSARHLYC